ncbi:MAG TPA: VWA domain-containing protein [Thermoanaerobaculia bacterium]|nr:VWA domain-containing protein [Thermoanaerobaculia bacterium]
MSLRRLTAVASLAALLSPAGITAQQMPQLGETMEVSIINVDVVVTDKQGNRVHGLTKNDFEIYERGKAQPISNFAEYSSGVERTAVAADGEGTVAAAQNANATQQRQPRTVVVFLENMRLPAYAAKKFFGAIDTFLANNVGPEDRVSLVYWNPYTASHIDFTSNVESIAVALLGIEKISTGARLDDTDQVRSEIAQLQAFEEGVQANLSKLGGEASTPSGTTVAGGYSDGTNMNEGTWSLMMPMTMSLVEMKRRVHAVNSTIATMGAGEGRKLLLLATRRFGKIAGAEYQYLSGQTNVPNAVRQQYDTTDLVKTVIANANANGVSIYPLFTQKFLSELPDAEHDSAAPFGTDSYTLMNEQANLNLVAHRTGGMAAYSVKDIVELMPEITADVNDYYSLAYRVTEKREDRARQISVKVKNRDYRVRNRETFVEKSDETRMKDRLTAALFTANNESPIAIATDVGERQKRGRAYSIPLTIRIPISALTTIPQSSGKEAGAFTVYVAGAADLDELSNFTRKTQPFEIKAGDVQKAQAGHFTYTLDVLVNAKTRNVAVGVLDEISKSYGVQRIDVAREAQNAQR